MAQEFRPVSIPMTSGAREDQADLVTENPGALQVAENVLFTRSGSVRPRPGTTVHTAETALKYNGLAAPTVTTLASATTLLLPAGIVTSRAEAGQDVPVALWQSAAYHRTLTGIWSHAGPFWSCRQQTSVGITSLVGDDTSVRVSCGVDNMGCRTNQGIGRGLPVLDDAGRVIAVETVGGAEFELSSDPLTGTTGGVCANTATFFVDATAHILYMIKRGATPGAATRVQVITDAHDVLAVVWSALNNRYVVAVRDYTTNTLIHVLSVTTAGVADWSTTITAAAAVHSVAIATDGGNTFAVAAAVVTNGTMYSWVLNFDSLLTGFSVLSGASTHVIWDGLNIGGLPSTPTTICGYVTVGFDSATVPNVVVTGAATSGTSSRCLCIFARPHNNTTSTIVYRVMGATQSVWQPLFGSVRFAGRWVMGLQRMTGEQEHPAVTWYVIEVPEYTSATVFRDLQVVAAGKTNGSTFTIPTNATVYVDALSADHLRFGVVDARTYEVDSNEVSVATAETVRIDLTIQPAAAVQVGGGLYLSGTVPYMFDGDSMRPAGFFDEPVIRGASEGGAASTLLPAASYTYQVMWRRTDRLGNVTRSRVSLPFTRTTASPALTVSVSHTKPQLLPLSDVLDDSAVTIELYATVGNPSDGADLYLVDSYTYEATAANDTKPLIHNVEATADLFALYTGGGVIEDERPPGGDRGIAVAGDRIWVADAQYVYPSKLATPGISPAWSNEEGMRVGVPGGLGTIVSLCGMDDKLVVLCSGGIFVVLGSGFDDLLEGQGWGTQVVSNAGCLGGPRGCALIPQGVTFMGTDGEVYLLDRSLSVACISRPLRLQNQGTATQDLVYVPGGTDVGDEVVTNPLLVVTGDLGASVSVGRSKRVFDLDVGQWSTWKTGTSDDPIE